MSAVPVLMLWLCCCGDIGDPFLGNPNKFLSRSGHIVASVVADAQNAVGSGVVQGIAVQMIVLHNGAAAGWGGGIWRDKHFRIKCNAHALCAEGQDCLDIFRLQNDSGSHLGFLKDFVRYGAYPVALF